MKPIRKIPLFYLLIMAIVVFSMSCNVSEDRSDCEGNCNIIRVNYTYLPFDKSLMQGIDVTEVDRIDLFAFDANGKFYDRWIDYPENFDSNYYMTVYLEPGNYTLVSWTNLDEHYQVEPDNLVQGKTSLSDVYLHLERYGTDTIQHTPHVLLFGDLHQAQVIGVGEEEFTIGLIQNTYRVNVTVEGLEPDEDDYSVVITDNNGSYTFRNEFVPVTALHYRGSCDKDAIHTLTTSVNMMRITYERSPLFRLINETQNKVIYQGNLVQLIQLLSKDGIPIDFNVTYEFDILLVFRNGVLVNVSINGWNVMEDSGQIYS